MEFAFIGPMLLVLLLGMISYGGYFWTAHAVQQVANDAARAGLAGLDAAERHQIVRQVVSDQIDDYAYLKAAHAAVSLNDLGDRYVVRVAYDASGSPFWSMSRLVPMPSQVVTREASVRLGGY